MKILHVNTNNAGGGVEQYLNQVLSELNHRGHSNTFLFGHKCPNQSAKVNAKSRYIEAITHYKCKNQKSKLIEVRDILSKLDPDLIYIHQVFNPALIDILTSTRPSIRFIHDYKMICPDGLKKLKHRHENCLYPLGYSCQARAFKFRCMPRNILKGLPLIAKSRRINWFHKNRSYIVVASEFMKSALLYNGFDIHKIAVIPYFTELPQIDNGYRHNTAPNVLALGRLVKAKGMHHLLNAFCAVRKNAHLAIVGDGPEFENLKELAEKLYLVDRVTFYGWLSREKLDHIFRKIDLVVVPSVWPEPFGIVGIEAMAYQKPVIASNAGGISEWCDNNKSGFLVEPGNAGELAKKINLLLDNRELSIQMGLKGRDTVEKKFCSDVHINALVSFIEKIIQDKAGRNDI